MVAIKHEKKTPPPVGTGNQLLPVNRSSTSPFSVSSAPSQITASKSSPAPSNSSSSGGQQPQSTAGNNDQIQCELESNLYDCRNFTVGFLRYIVSQLNSDQFPVNLFAGLGFIDVFFITGTYFHF